MDNTKSSNGSTGNLMKWWPVPTFYSLAEAVVSQSWLYICTKLKHRWNYPNTRPIQTHLRGKARRPANSPGDSNMQPIWGVTGPKTKKGGQQWEKQAGCVKSGVLNTLGSQKPHTGCVFNEHCWYLAPASCCLEGTGAHCCQIFWLVKDI